MYTLRELTSFAFMAELIRWCACGGEYVFFMSGKLVPRCSRFEKNNETGWYEVNGQRIMSVREFILGLFGVYGNRIPPHEHGKAYINGNYTFVLHTSDEMKRRRNFHRLYVVCPICEKEIPIGRLAQHAKSHKDFVEWRKSQ